jgi:hypothetical protein
MKVLLRTVLTLLLVLVGLKVGILLAPRLATAMPELRMVNGELRKAPGFHDSQLTIHHFLQPDWGGGSLSFPNGSARMSDRSDSSDKSDIPGVIRRKPGGDYDLALALPAGGQSGRTGRFELPSASHFKQQLLPGAGDAEAPAADIPLYPQSSCRMQVGRGTACFTGFYLTPDSVEAVRSFYVRVLSQLGWQRVTADRAGFLETFAKRNEDRTVVVQLRKQDSVTTRIGLVATTSGSPDRNERK